MEEKKKKKKEKRTNSFLSFLNIHMLNGNYKKNI